MAKQKPDQGDYVEIEDGDRGALRGVVDLVMADQFAVVLDQLHWGTAQVKGVGSIPVNTRYICKFDAPWRKLDEIELVCVNGHGRCHEGTSLECPYCERRFV